MMSPLLFLILLTEGLASPAEYWAMASSAVRKARALHGREAGRALGELHGGPCVVRSGEQPDCRWAHVVC